MAILSKSLQSRIERLEAQLNPPDPWTYEVTIRPTTDRHADVGLTIAPHATPGAEVDPSPSSTPERPTAALDDDLAQRMRVFM